jgi:hypothetical protein
MRLILEYDTETSTLAADLSGVKDEAEMTARIQLARTLAGLLHPRVENLELWLPAQSPVGPAPSAPAAAAAE